MSRKSVKAAEMEAREQAEKVENDARFEHDRWAFFVEATAKAFQYKNVMLHLGYGEAPFEVRNTGDRFVLELEAPAAADSWKVRLDSNMQRNAFMSELFELENELNVMETMLEHQKLEQLARKKALAKLTTEERELLGLPKF